MAFRYSPKIVTDGLVLCLDAANPRSIVSGSTTWYDLTKNLYNGDLINGPTFDGTKGGSVVFDGIDDRVSKVGAIDTGQNFTVNAWIFPTLLGTTRRTVVGNGYPYSSRDGWLLCTAGGGVNDTFFLSIGADVAYRVASANTLSTNKWQYISATVTGGGSSITLYKNGETTTTSMVSLVGGTITYTNTEFNVGFRNTVSVADPFTGNLSSVTIYNKELTQQEVLQNYNATKSRFGL